MGKYKDTTAVGGFKVKRARVDEKATLPVLGFVLTDKVNRIASYKVAYMNVKQGKLHPVKLDALKMEIIMLGKAAEDKISQNSSFKRLSSRIYDMSKGILAQLKSWQIWFEAQQNSASNLLRPLMYSCVM